MIDFTIALLIASLILQGGMLIVLHRMDRTIDRMLRRLRGA